MRWPCRSCKCFVLWTVVHNPASMRGLLAKASRRAVLKSVLVVPVGDMLHAQATAAVVATTTGSPRTVAMQPAANVARCEKVTFALLGDIMLGRYVDDQFEFAQRKTGAFGDVLPVLKRLDPKCSIVVGNLECAVTKHARLTPKTFNFKLLPKHADVLQQLLLSYVSLANNHVLDYEVQGLRETHKVLDELGIAHSGSGINLQHASAPAIVTRGRYKIAFLSYADHYEEWAAGDEAPGINYIDPAKPKDLDKVRQQIKSVRDEHRPDLLLVFVHWGPNWRWQPDKHIRQLGREMLDAGADLVFGHSAHHLQGVEFVGNKAIIYGAGAFIDDYATDDVYRNDLGCLWLAKYSTDAQQPAPAAAAASLGETHAAAAAAAAASARSLNQIRIEHQAGNRREAPTLPAAAAAAADSDVDIQKKVLGSGENHMSGSSSSSGAIATTVLSGPESSVPDAADTVSGALQLKSLTAVPIHIRQIWRAGEHKEPGAGYPPYFSQVDLARGSDYEWVAQVLGRLCKDMGTAVVTLPKNSGIQLMPELEDLE